MSHAEAQRREESQHKSPKRRMSGAIYVIILAVVELSKFAFLPPS
ncbi:MAG TPA: hypothetical protein VK184_02000 [Nostocaceae cyanobacterium]|nr:hypothetical protein [Nostocaceae cyanobacterium]